MTTAAITLRTLDQVADRGFPPLARAVRQVRWRILDLVHKHRGNRAAIIPAAIKLLTDAEPTLTQAVARAQVMAWVGAAKSTLESHAITAAKQLARIGEFVDPPRSPSPPALPPVPPSGPSAWEQSGDGVKLIIPARAAEYLRTRIDFTPDEFASLADDAKQVGFTVAKQVSLDAVEAVRNVLLDDVASGGTLKDFREAIEGELDTALSPAQIETLYRTQVGRAYSAGQIAVLNNPFVRRGFPYLLYSATHDSRVRPEHLQMETLGLDGTAVYRTDDPIWDLFYPPWAWNCRCVAIPLSVSDAARRGVREAIQWKKTGQPPAFPEYVRMPNFSPPRGWVPTGRKLVAV